MNYFYLWWYSDRRPLRKQSQIPFSTNARPSEKMASQILHLMTMPSLDLFCNNSIEPSEMQTQRKSIKRPSQCQSLQNLERKQSWNYQQQILNSRDLEYSLPADLVTTSKYLQQYNEEQKFSAFKTSDFSKKDASSHTITMNQNLQIVFQSLLNGKRRIKKWTRSHRWHWGTSHFAQFA